MVKIYTGKISKYKGEDGLDITIMTGEIAFVPSWEMVRGSKNGTMNQEEYKKKYLERMRKSYIKCKKIWEWVLAQMEPKEVLVWFFSFSM